MTHNIRGRLRKIETALQADLQAEERLRRVKDSVIAFVVSCSIPDLMFGSDPHNEMQNGEPAPVPYQEPPITVDGVIEHAEQTIDALYEGGGLIEEWPKERSVRLALHLMAGHSARPLRAEAAREALATLGPSDDDDFFEELQP